MNKLDVLSSFTPVISDLIHELQKERGSSAVLISSQGAAQYSSGLDDQRASSDNIKRIFEQSLDEFPLENYGEEFVTKINQANINLQNLTTERDKVSGLSVTVSQMASYYTGTIRSYINVIKEAARQTNNAELLNDIVVYIAIIDAKEKAGMERATGNAGFASGTFTAASLQRFSALAAEQIRSWRRSIPMLLKSRNPIMKPQFRALMLIGSMS